MRIQHGESHPFVSSLADRLKYQGPIYMTRCICYTMNLCDLGTLGVFQVTSHASAYDVLVLLSGLGSESIGVLRICS